jgi:hypothetical protein
MHMTTRFWVARVATVLTLTLASGSASATLIARESFEYDAGTLTALNGGTGWGGAWTTSGGIGEVQTTGLTYTDTMGNNLAVSGNSVIINAPTGTASAQFLRLLSGSVGDAGGVTTWMSFIGERLSPHATDDENLARAASLQLHSTTASERLAIGKGTTSIASPPIPSGWAMLHTGNAANSVYTTKSQLLQSFLVVRVDHVGDTTVADNAWIWVNPRLDIEPDINAADASLPGSLGTSADFTFNRIRAFAGAMNATTGPYASLAFDELRLGTTYADVAPIAANVDASFDADTDVDGNDFLIWQRGLGAGPGALNTQGDADGNGLVNGADLTAWRGVYGTQAVVAASAVPEPAAATLAVILGLALAAMRRR